MEYTTESFKAHMEKYPSRSQREAYLKGERDGKYGFSYIDPYWSTEEINAWADGYMQAKGD